jgi:hypothetical protein
MRLFVRAFNPFEIMDFKTFSLFEQEVESGFRSNDKVTFVTEEGCEESYKKLEHYAKLVNPNIVITKEVTI